MSSLLTFYNENRLEAGCDEAGRGCLAGPVVAASVILPKDFDHKWLNDSKKLRPDQREEMRILIEKNAVTWAVGMASAEEIDQINILQASFLAMHRAIDQLWVKPELLLIDGNRFRKYHQIEHVCIVSGDALYRSIAAASILAKTYRDKLMTDLNFDFPDYGWISNKGYPTFYHKTAIARVGLSPHHRLTFNSAIQPKLPLGE
jgi:ribonuclease HII